VKPSNAHERSRATLAASALGIVAVGAYSSVAIPVLIPPIQSHFGLGEGQVGALASLGMAGGVFGGLVGGLLADRFGRLRVLRAFVLLAAAGNALCGLGTDVWLLRVGLAAQGFGYGAVMVCCAGLLSSLFPNRRRGSFSALLVTHAAAGMILPFIVEALKSPYADGRVSFFVMVPAPFLCVAGLLVFLVAPLFRVAEPAIAEGSDAEDETCGQAAQPGDYRSHAVVAAIAVIVLLAAIHGMSDAVLFTWMTKYLREGFTTHPFPPGWVLSFYSAAYLAGRLGLALLPDRFGRRALIVLPGLIAGPLALMAVHASSFGLTAGLYVAATFLYGLEFPALMGLASQRFPARFATIFGLVSAGNLLCAVGIWGAGEWTEAVGSMKPAMSLAASGFILFGVLAAFWLATQRRAAQSPLPPGEG